MAVDYHLKQSDLARACHRIWNTLALSCLSQREERGDTHVDVRDGTEWSLDCLKDHAAHRLGERTAQMCDGPLELRLAPSVRGELLPLLDQLVLLPCTLRLQAIDSCKFLLCASQLVPRLLLAPLEIAVLFAPLGILPAARADAWTSGVCNSKAVVS